LLDESAHSIHALTETLSILAEIVTTYAEASSLQIPLSGRSSVIQWPLVTLPGFSTHARHVKPEVELHSEAESHQIVWMSNIVSARQRELWEENSAIGSSSSILCLVDGELRPCPSKEAYCPVHQFFPNTAMNGTYDESKSPRNFDMFSDESLASMYEASRVGRKVALSGMVNISMFRDFFTDRILPDEKVSVMARPVYRTLEDDSTDIVAYVHVVVRWGRLFVDLLHTKVNLDVYVVMLDTCDRGSGNTFLVTSDGWSDLGPGDRHDPKLEKYKISSILDLGSDDAAECSFRVSLYPSAETISYYKTTRPIHYAGVIASTFIAIFVSFFLYDRFVRRRNHKIMNSATQTIALLSDLFPRAIRDNLLRQKMDQEKSVKETRSLKMGLRRYLRSDTESSMDMTDGGSNTASGTYDVYRPLADLFAETTVMFADLAGFTAWSSGTFCGKCSIHSI
jgi:hypothetical protein